MSVREVYEAACKRADENWRMFLESQAQLAEARKELELLRRVANTASVMRKLASAAWDPQWIAQRASFPGWMQLEAALDALREWENKK